LPLEARQKGSLDLAVKRPNRLFAGIAWFARLTSH